MRSFWRGAVVGIALGVIVSSSQAYILIDDFTGGYFKATITGQGNKDNLASGLDKAHTYAGHRYTNYTCSGNPFGYTTSFEVGLGEALVTTPGPQDLSTQLNISYGTDLFEPLRLNMTSEDRFEIMLQTDPFGLLAPVWSVSLMDNVGRSVSSSNYGTIVGGIRFLKTNFTGSSLFDWANVDEFSFNQDWDRTLTAPLSYSVSEIRAVPEPFSFLPVLFVSLGLRLRTRYKPNLRPTLQTADSE